MRCTRLASILIFATALSACASTAAQKSASAPPPQPKELSVPVGKNWKVVEEPPVLINERDERPAFQKEQSIQPEGVKHPTAPEKGRTVETPR